MGSVGMVWPAGGGAVCALKVVLREVVVVKAFNVHIHSAPKALSEAVPPPLPAAYDASRPFEMLMVSVWGAPLVLGGARVESCTHHLPTQTRPPTAGLSITIHPL